MTDDPLWYKDAIIYQAHVKAFFDADDDGMGDFKGVTAKLDYMVDLGVTAVWILPFYPSPLRDDGYDIADYKAVNPRYGTMKDFRTFVKEAHKRGLKVITELVINHTSDQHPWFQKARTSPKGSKWRNFYVWSDTDQKYPGTRIIFLDTEPSNWSWDPVAQQYYWHRFFSHQPDLNWDNPAVFDEITKVMKFWFDAGVDGMRLDAIPYLIERDGTNNENLPETHTVIKRLRAWVDEHFPGRMFLGEANQWPEDVLPYFGEGEGDECNMAFHFPLMPRMYMALAQEDRLPVTDIMRQTPDIPATAQWAIFLRNHDELTLEMVTDRERDYLWNFYAMDPRARINLGIRRRLAPLVDNDRRKIELLNSMLMSMPGTPIVYYGDEIGMGDNIYLGDRDGVRTPMQWTMDRNGGFSKADPAKLYLPCVMDPVYGYTTVNVEAQSRSQWSLLNWMRRLINVRKMHQSFGRGEIKFLYPGNRKVLAYLREHEGESILCVCNLSRAPQAVELDLRDYATRVPIELIGRSPFPPIGDLPYLLTLPAYGFYWFLLADEAEAPGWHVEAVQAMPELMTLVVGNDLATVTQGRNKDMVESQILRGFLPNQRWFAAKGEEITEVTGADHALLRHHDAQFLLPVYTVNTRSGKPGDYFLPLSVAWETRADDPFQRLAPFSVAKVRRGPTVGALHDATADPAFTRAMVESMLAGKEVETGAGGKLKFVPTDTGRAIEFDRSGEIQRLSREQSNTSVVVGTQMVMKILRRLEQGIHPEIEVGRYLTDVANFEHIPPLYGSVVLEDSAGRETALAVLQGFVRNQGDGWAYTLDYLDRVMEEAELASPEAAEEDTGMHEFFLTLAGTLGTRVAEMHKAFALQSDDPAFTPEPATEKDFAAWADGLRRQADEARRMLERALPGLADDLREDVERLFAQWDAIDRRVESLRGLAAAGLVKTRFHGDFHLGQVLMAHNDWVFLDFEGEPTRKLEERRSKNSALKDVAGMLRSFNYAGWSALLKRAEYNPQAMERIGGFTADWEAATAAAFLLAYRESIAGCPVWPDDGETAAALLEAFTLEKALYEVCYEVANRPDWLRIPLQGVLRLVVPERPEE
ncbi:MAG: maltose alpha-D-glucosyltransferase [Caenispirillum bisanense]|nr:maltose alpha-D-glucosyltransferase [Caenispirillum bisanense]MCA1971629.1 maltose alpha-D-glucosyltransferase [Caenispirillum sp.]